MKIYIVTFKTYNTGKFQISMGAWISKAKAELEAKELRANGHTDVKVYPVYCNDLKIKW